LHSVASTSCSDPNNIIPATFPTTQHNTSRNAPTHLLMHAATALLVAKGGMILLLPAVHLQGSASNSTGLRSGRPLSCDTTHAKLVHTKNPAHGLANLGHRSAASRWALLQPSLHKALHRQSKNYMNASVHSWGRHRTGTDGRQKQAHATHNCLPFHYSNLVSHNASRQ
jgi:hypothetical protein